jgi:Ulp1 family protease
MATIANQNGRHMVQHVLLPVNIHFHWNLFIFEFLTIYFEMAAILKILKTKSTTLRDDLFLCQVSKGSAVRSEFNIFCTLVTMATATILNLFNPPKAATHYGGYSYKVSWSLMKGIQILFNSEKKP